MNTATRVRLARKRADRLNLKLIKNGHHFRLRDADEITLAVGHLGVVEAFLAAAKSQNKPPGPPPSLHAPPSWRRDIDDYLLNLNAAGQRPATIRLRKTVLCAAAHGLGRPPADVTAEHLLDWLGKQQHLSPEGRKPIAARCGASSCGPTKWTGCATMSQTPCLRCAARNSRPARPATTSGKRRWPRPTVESS